MKFLIYEFQNDAKAWCKKESIKISLANENLEFIQSLILSKHKVFDQ